MQWIAFEVPAVESWKTLRAEPGSFVKSQPLECWWKENRSYGKTPLKAKPTYMKEIPQNLALSMCESREILLICVFKNHVKIQSRGLQPSRSSGPWIQGLALASWFSLLLPSTACPLSFLRKRMLSLSKIHLGLLIFSGLKGFLPSAFG